MSARAEPQVRLFPAWKAALGDHVIDLAWRPDGAVLAAGEVSGALVLLDPASGRPRATPAGHRQGLTALAWHPEAPLLATAGQDGRVCLRDGDDGEVRRVLDGTARWMEHLAWSPSGRFLAAAGGKVTRLWTRDGVHVRDFPARPSTVAALAWRPGTDELAIASYGGIVRWQPEAGSPVAEHEWKGSVLVIAWSPDGRFLATGDQDSTMHFWVLATGQPLQMWGYPTKVRELAWDASGRWLATGGSDTVVVWDCATSPEGTTPVQCEGHADYISVLAYQHRGPALASGGQDGRVFLWAPAARRGATAAGALAAPIARLAWRPDDRAFAAGTADGTVALFPLD